MADIDTNQTNHAQAASEMEDNEPHEPQHGPSRPTGHHQSRLSGSGRWIRFWRSLVSRCPKWPGWPGFWQSRFSGVPVALIFGLYVYYLLVFVMLSTNVEVETKKPMSNKSWFGLPVRIINASEIISKIK